MKHTYLISDMDGTLLGGSAADYATFTQRVESLKHLKFCIATGRSSSKAFSGLQEHALPLPYWAICSVGTEVIVDGAQDDEWLQQLQQGWTPSRIKAIMESFPEFRFSDDDQQSTFKLTYQGHDLADRALEVSKALFEQGISCQAVYSHNWFLDILPEGAGKANAIHFLSEKFSVDLQDIATIGDSNNDRDMLEMRGLKTSAVVSNYRHEEMHHWLQHRPDIIRLQGEATQGVIELINLLEID